MRTIWGRKGQAITLPCSVDPSEDQNYSLEWRKNNKLILSAYGKEAGHSAPSLQGRLARDGGVGLTIHSIEVDDGGVFHCVVTRFTKQPTRPEHGPSVRLVVNVGPRIIAPETGLVDYVKMGDNMQIECKVEGAPSPEVTWTKNDRIVSSSAILHIANMTEADKGIYTCLAINVEGKDESNIELRFSKSTTFDFVPSNKTVVVGSNVFWHCHASSQPDRITYGWTFQDRPIKKTPTGLRADLENGDLSLREVRKSDSGWYRCEATNQRSEISQTSAFLDVQYVPESLPNHRQVVTVRVGQNTTLSCKVDANPAANHFSWTKNGHFLNASEQDFHVVTDARDSDGGIYRCEASNIIGKGLPLETHLIVAEPPIFVSRPPTELRVREGTPLEIPCEGFGDPLPIVYWKHNEIRISTSTLSFPSVSNSDHGKYECVVSNAVSTISSPMNLLVERSKPQPASISDIVCKGENELEVQWQPGFDGSHSQSFVVHFSADEDRTPKSVATTNNSVTLTDLRPFGTYEIAVESRNKKGSATSEKKLKPVCSTLPSPSDVSLVESAVRWSRVEHAKSYRIESRGSTKHAFRELGEVVHPYFRLNGIPEDKFMELRVRSLRPHYHASSPSNSVEIGKADQNEVPIVWALCGGIFVFMLFLSIWMLCRGKTSRHRKQRRRNNDYVCPASGSQQTETYYEPSLNFWTAGYDEDSEESDSGETALRLDDGDYREWTGSRDESLRIPYPKSILQIDYGSMDEEQSAIEDMLRQKYIYGVEDVPTQLITDLRIERLRREYQQSQI